MCSTHVKPQELTPVHDVVRYRLRREGRIVGWMREESTGQRFYSREGLWWSGRKIQWNQRDRCCGLRDVDDRWLHEGDVVRMTEGPWWRRRNQWLILCDEASGWTALRLGWGGRNRTLNSEALQGCRLRWSGFGWSPTL